MPAHMWSDPGTWIALGISALFLVVGFLMHRVIRSVLRAPEPPSTTEADTPSQPVSTHSKDTE